MKNENLKRKGTIYNIGSSQKRRSLIGETIENEKNKTQVDTPINNKSGMSLWTAFAKKSSQETIIDDGKSLHEEIKLKHG